MSAKAKPSDDATLDGAMYNVKTKTWGEDLSMKAAAYPVHKYCTPSTLSIELLRSQAQLKFHFTRSDIRRVPRGDHHPNNQHHEALSV